MNKFFLIIMAAIGAGGSGLCARELTKPVAGRSGLCTNPGRAGGSHIPGRSGR